MQVRRRGTLDLAAATILIHSATVAQWISAGLVHTAMKSLGVAYPDAGLLRLCAMFHDADARCHAAPDDGRDWKRWLDRRWEVSTCIQGVVPQTAEGRHAKARVALVLMTEAADTDNEYERFVLATLRDLVTGDAE